LYFLCSDHSLEAGSHVTTAVAESFSGVFKLRFPQQGHYKLLVIHSTSKKVLSSVQRVHVRLCEDNVIPQDWQLQSKYDNKEEEEKPPRPLVRHAGVLAVSGHHAVLVPQSVLPPLSSAGGGSFAVSFWIRLLDSPAGNFRAFFYKGDGNDPNRTPSAWLIPTSNRLAIRSTTADTPDLGADSTLSIPLNQWSHVCIVFDNRTQVANGAGGGYKIVTYIDGQLDISIGYSTEVIPNNSSFQMFKDVSHDGPRSLVADLVVWDSPLTDIQVRNLASTSATSNFQRWTQPVDLALDLMDGISVASGGESGQTGVPDDSGLSAREEVVDEEATFSDDLHEGFDLLLDSLPLADTTPASSVPLEYLLKEITAAVETCAAPSARLDLYAEAASLGMYVHVDISHQFIVCMYYVITCVKHLQMSSNKC
jgi:hypothetical protein